MVLPGCLTIVLGFLFILAYYGLFKVKASLQFNPLLPLLGTIYMAVGGLIVLVQFNSVETSEQTEDTLRLAEIVLELSNEIELLSASGVTKRTRAEAEKIAELKDALEARITEAEKRLRGEWRFVVVLVVTILVSFAAMLLSMKK